MKKSRRLSFAAWCVLVPLLIASLALPARADNRPVLMAPLKSETAKAAVIVLAAGGAGGAMCAMMQVIWGGVKDVPLPKDGINDADAAS